MRKHSSFDRREGEQGYEDYGRREHRGRPWRERTFDSFDEEERFGRWRPLDESERSPFEPEEPRFFRARSYPYPWSERREGGPYGRANWRESGEARRSRPYERFEEPWWESRGSEPRRGFEDRSSWGERAMRAYGPYAGQGPKNYRRSDERLREEVCDRLTDHPLVDAQDVTVTVHEGEITLEGNVLDRTMKRMAEDCAESVSGVQEVHNHLRVTRSSHGIQAGESPESEGGSGRNSPR